MDSWTIAGVITSAILAFLALLLSVLSTFKPSWLPPHALTSEELREALEDQFRTHIPRGQSSQYVTESMMALVRQPPPPETFGALLRDLSDELRRSNRLSQRMIQELQGLRTENREALTEVKRLMTGIDRKVPEQGQLQGLISKALEEERNKARPSAFAADVAAG